MLCVACNDQTISFHMEDGQIIGFEKKIKFEISCIDWYSSGEYFIAGGGGGIVNIFSREGALLQEIESGFEWVWSIRFENTANAFAIGGSKGQIKLQAFDKLMPYSASEDKFATRIGMTEVIIKDLHSDRKAKFRCKELINNISLYNNFLAVHTPSRVLLYEEISLRGDED